jgi:hypothetical protein
VRGAALTGFATSRAPRNVHPPSHHHTKHSPSSPPPPPPQRAGTLLAVLCACLCCCCRPLLSSNRLVFLLIDATLELVRRSSTRRIRSRPRLPCRAFHPPRHQSQPPSLLCHACWLLRLLACCRLTLLSFRGYLPSLVDAFWFRLSRGLPSPAGSAPALRSRFRLPCRPPALHQSTSHRNPCTIAICHHLWLLWLWLLACCRRTPSVTVDRATFLRSSTGSRAVYRPQATFSQLPCRPLALQSLPCIAPLGCCGCLPAVAAPPQLRWTGQSSFARRRVVVPALARSSTPGRLRPRSPLSPPLPLSTSAPRLPLAVPTLGPSTIHRHRHDPCITNALCHRAGVVAALLPAVAAPPSVTLDRATSLRPPMLPGCGSRTVFHDAGSAPLGLRATTVAPPPSAQHLVRGCCLLACAAAAPLLSSSGSGCFGVPRRCCAACERSFHCRLRSIRSTLSFFHPT